MIEVKVNVAEIRDVIKGRVEAPGEIFTMVQYK